jgi:large subunit ribosomal protein L6
MSRVGKLPIAVPSGVTITVDDDFVTVTGPKGTLQQFTVPGVKFALEDGQFTVSRESDIALHRANHGLMRALVNNMVVGVTKGFEKKLEINGVGYRANMEGKNIKLSLGYSHDITFEIPEGVQAKVEGNVITVSGISKQQVGQVAAEIRKLRKPEPYKGKGIKYEDERIIRKSGKSGKDK